MMSAVLEPLPSCDWSVYGGHELGLEEVRKLGKENPNIWAWANGMLIAGTDDYIALRFHKGATYEPVTRELWKRLCRGAELVADVGTHSGVFTLDAYRSGAKFVLAAEPHPINYARLVVNVRYNNFRCDGLFYGALGDKNEVSEILVKGGIFKCYAAGRVGMHNVNGVELPVRVRRMDSLLPESIWGSLKVAKIDAENYTPNVLRGMGGILEHRPDLIVECTASGMEEILKPYGYKFWRIWESGRIEEVEDLKPHNPDNNYNGTMEDCRNRFASVRGLP